MVNNTYKRWIEYIDTDKQYFLYLSYKQFFGKRFKNRVTKKWHSRNCKERSKRYKQLAKVDNRYKIYFGKTVYTYYNHDNDVFGFTIKPKQIGCKSYTSNYAICISEGYYRSHHLYNDFQKKRIGE